MNTIQLKSKVTFDELIQAVEQLETSDFEKLLSRILDLNIKRKTKHLSEEEAGLVLQINKGLSIDQKERLDTLTLKKENTSLDTDEKAEMEALIKVIEKIHFERIMAIGQLAQLRNQSVNEVVEEFGFEAINN